MDSTLYIRCISKEGLESILEYSYLNYIQCSKSNNYLPLDFVMLEIRQILLTSMQSQIRIISRWNQESLVLPSLIILRKPFHQFPRFDFLSFLSSWITSLDLYCFSSSKGNSESNIYGRGALTVQGSCPMPAVPSFSYLTYPTTLQTHFQQMKKKLTV